MLYEAMQETRKEVINLKNTGAWFGKTLLDSYLTLKEINDSLKKISAFLKLQ